MKKNQGTKLEKQPHTQYTCHVFKREGLWFGRGPALNDCHGTVGMCNHIVTHTPKQNPAQNNQEDFRYFGSLFPLESSSTCNYIIICSVSIWRSIHQVDLMLELEENWAPQICQLQLILPFPIVPTQSRLDLRFILEKSLVEGWELHCGAFLLTYKLLKINMLPVCERFLNFISIIVFFSKRTIQRW